MTRTKLLSLTAATAIAATGAIAETPQAATGTSSDVASQAPLAYDTNSPKVAIGNSAKDISGIGISTDKILALAAVKGEMLKTNEGTEIGLIQDVSYNAQGNPELIVDVLDRAAIGADTLVMTLQPGNIDLATNRIILDTSYAELLLKVKADGGPDSADRVDVTLF